MINKIMLVGLGGFVGASSRYIVSFLSAKLLGENFPYGTLFVNVIGCFVIGIIMSLKIPNEVISTNVRLLIATGILGGLTTFSTFSYETINLLGSGRHSAAIINIFLNLILCLGGVIVGRGFYRLFA